MENKKCCSCKETKDLSEFNKNKSKKSGYNNICKICSKNRFKKYYNKNKEKHKSNVKNRKDKLKIENRLKLFKYLNGNPCIDCGIADPIVLQFDHINPENKLNEISQMITSGYLWESILEEIKKCEVRCANCHSRKTSKQQNWYKYIFSENKLNNFK